MAHVVGIVGRSGSGKSSGAKFLNADTTLYINADKKPLPFKGWTNSYNTAKGNYFEIDKPNIIIKILKSLQQGKTDKGNDLTHFKRVIIDTGNGIMVGDEMRRMHEKSFDKWADLVTSIWEILQLCQELPKDIIVYFLFHEESYLDEDGIRTTRVLTNGKKLNKIQLATRLTTVLWAKTENIDKGQNRHYFETKLNNNEAKSPEGMFDTFEIANDFTIVEKAIREYDETQIDEKLITKQ